MIKLDKVIDDLEVFYYKYFNVKDKISQSIISDLLIVYNDKASTDYTILDVINNYKVEDIMVTFKVGRNTVYEFKNNPNKVNNKLFRHLRLLITVFIANKSS